MLKRIRNKLFPKNNPVFKKGLEREIGETHIVTLYQYTYGKTILYEIKIAPINRTANTVRECHVTHKDDALEIYTHFVRKYVESYDRVSMIWQDPELMNLEFVFQVKESDNYCISQEYRSRKEMKDLLTKILGYK